MWNLSDERQKQGILMNILTERLVSVKGKLNISVNYFSFLIGPGFPLINDVVLGIFYLIVLCYIFLGVAIASDIFME